MRRVLFVDDEPKILTGLRRSLRAYRNEWEMVFAESGTAALEQCASAPFDIVISDARMPGMEGSVFLRHVMELYPDTARLILSGQCSRTSVLKCVAVAHQFLSKPCEPETLRSAVQGICRLRDAFHDGPTREAISRTQWLPSQVRLRGELAQAIESPEASVGTMAGIIARDIGMTAKVVQLVSSGFFGSPQHVAGAREAVRLLGLETIRALFAAPAGCPTSPDGRGAGRLQALADHSFAVGSAAGQIMETLTDDRILIGDAHLAGTLHEVGTLALTDFGAGSPRHADLTISTGARQCFTGRPSGFGCARLDPGGYLAALWGLPASIVQAIAYHQAPSACPEPAVGPLTAVHVANAMLEQASEHVNESDSRLAMDYLEGVGCADRLRCWRDICDACRPEGAAS